jgi:hypothetical protein
MSPPASTRCRSLRPFASVRPSTTSARMSSTSATTTRSSSCVGSCASSLRSRSPPQGSGKIRHLSRSCPSRARTAVMRPHHLYGQGLARIPPHPLERLIRCRSPNTASPSPTASLRALRCHAWYRLQLSLLHNFVRVFLIPSLPLTRRPIVHHERTKKNGAAISSLSHGAAISNPSCRHTAAPSARACPPPPLIVGAPLPPLHQLGCSSFLCNTLIFIRI